MTSLDQGPSLEDRIRAATRAAASTVPDDGAPPLQLRAQRRQVSRLPAGFHRPWTSPRIKPGRPWLPRLVAPLAATAAVIAVIATSVAVADRSPSLSPAGGLAGVPRYYLELVSAGPTGGTAAITATGPATTISSATTGQLVSPTASATASSPAATGQLVSPTASATASSPAATGQLVSPTASATASSPSATGSASSVKLHMTSLGADFGQRAIIRETVTGATVAAVSPPRPFDSFVMASAAADDRTFVLAAQKSSSSLSSCGPIRLYLARFNPADRHVGLTALAVPEIPATSQVDAIALSPDGARLAVALEPGQICSRGGVVPLAGPGTAKNHEARQEEVSVYSLPTGTAKTWHSPPGWRDSGQVGPNAMSWATNGTLAFNYPGGEGTAGVYLHPGGQGTAGVYLLNTDSPGGSLLAYSQQAVTAVAPARLQRSHGTTTVWQGTWTWTGYGVLTPDGQTVVAPVQQTLRHSGGTGAAFAEFSALTGREFRVLWPEKVSQSAGLDPYYSVVWANSSGSVLVVTAPATRGGKTGAQSVYGVLHGARFTPIPGAPRPNAFALFSDTVIVF